MTLNQTQWSMLTDLHWAKGYDRRPKAWSLLGSGGASDVTRDRRYGYLRALEAEGLVRHLGDTAYEITDAGVAALVARTGRRFRVFYRFSVMWSCLPVANIGHSVWGGDLFDAAQFDHVIRVMRQRQVVFYIEWEAL